MAKICYETPKRGFRKDTLATIAQANEIIDKYRADGFDLTLRQLYYQCVSRGMIPNNVQEYKRLGDIVSKARRAGLIDWDAIVDRTRTLRGGSHGWGAPERVIESAASWFSLDIWAEQPAYCEVWFEKDALMGVFERACQKYRLPYFSCRGYSSDSEIWSAARRLRAESRGHGGEREIVILHFGDHDPSGVDMTRDIEERIALLGGPRSLEVRRLSLTMEQIQKFNPPPNPAKESDSRFEGYRKLYGDESWELDAMEPTYLAGLVETNVHDLIDQTAWEQVRAEERAGQRQIKRVANNYKRVLAYLDAHGEDTGSDDPDDEDEDEDADDE